MLAMAGKNEIPWSLAYVSWYFLTFFWAASLTVNTGVCFLARGRKKTDGWTKKEAVDEQNDLEHSEAGRHHGAT